MGMEEIWSCIDYYAKFTCASGGLLPKPTWRLNGARCELKRALLSLYGGSWNNLVKNVTKATSGTLVDILREQAKPGDVIVSLNYDTLVEQLARKVGVKLMHGPGSPRRNRAEIRFAKPHGSVSWRTGDHNLATLTGPPLATSLSPSDVRAEDTDTDPLLLGAVPIKSELIKEVQYCYAPHVFRLIMDQWKTVVEAFRDATVIVVVGYSFPKEDHYGRFLFAEGLRQRRKNLKKVEYYNVSRSSERAIREVFGYTTKVVWRREVKPLTLTSK
jgi:hypothetical protein